MDIKELEALKVRYETGEKDLIFTLEKEYSNLVENNPNNPKYIRDYGYICECLGRTYLQKAESMYETLLSKFKDNNGYNFRLDNHLLNLRNSLGRNKESIELYKKRILEYPDDPSEYVFLAMAYLYADQVQEAKKVMEAAEKIVSVPDANFYEVYGSVYQRLGDNEKALECWDKAVQDQYSMGGWFSRVFLFKELGRLEEAAAEWKKIINMLEKHHDPLYLTWPKEELAKIQVQLNK